MHLLFALITSATIAMASFDLGVKAPLQLGLNFTSSEGTWFGFIYGGGLAVEFKFMESSAESGLGMEFYGAYRGDIYGLPSDHFLSGSTLMQMKIAYGLNLKYWITQALYIGIGPMFTYTFGGQSADATVKKAFTSSMLGTEIYASACIGCSIALSEDVFIPIDIQASYNCTVPSSVPFELGANIGLMFRLAK